MKLFEFEGKKLFKKYGLSIPEQYLVTKSELGSLTLPGTWSQYYVKAQVLSGHRADHGLIKPAADQATAQILAHQLLQRTTEFPELEHVLIEQGLAYSQAMYVALTISTTSRSPVLLLSSVGGTGIEDKQQSIEKFTIDTLVGLHPANVRQLAYAAGLPAASIPAFIQAVMNMWTCFQEQDCLLAEINPLVLSADNQWVALDAKIEIDDDSAWRHQHSTFHPRNTLGRLPTSRELAAWQIDHNDHRGVAGSSYIELDGDIAILASGGGASLACMDALIAYGGRPANYTEYSGNPPREKVRRLTEIVLSQPNLKGCWVVGATANFTDILETLSGFLDGLRTINPKPTYPILIRRAGPHDREAFTMLKDAAEKEGYDFHLYGSETPMISTAKTMVDLYTTFSNKQ